MNTSSKASINSRLPVTGVALALAATALLWRLCGAGGFAPAAATAAGGLYAAPSAGACLCRTGCRRGSACDGGPASLAGLRATAGSGRWATCGRPATGPGALAAITGCREPGCSRRGSGVLWTPGYWGFVGGVYAFHAGYWGPHVGFYGGVNYGFGYGGVGFAGGRWARRIPLPTRSVTNVNVAQGHSQHLQRDRRQ